MAQINFNTLITTTLTPTVNRLKRWWRNTNKRRLFECIAVGLMLFGALYTFTHVNGSQQTLRLNDGKITYSGPILASKPTGKGKVTFDNGDAYIGDFKDGLFSGKGKFISHNGWRYEGHFERGLPQGQGQLTTKDNTIYDGTFDKGMYTHEN